MSRLPALAAALALACPIARASAAEPADPLDPSRPDAAWSADVGEAPAPPAHAARGDRSAARGALVGAGTVLYAFGRICVSGGGLMLIVCAIAVVEGWPYLVGATATGAMIGAAIGAPPPGRPARAEGRPPEPARVAPPPDAEPPPASEWTS